MYIKIHNIFQNIFFSEECGDDGECKGGDIPQHSGITSRFASSKLKIFQNPFILFFGSRGYIQVQNDEICSCQKKNGQKWAKNLKWPKMIETSGTNPQGGLILPSYTLTKQKKQTNFCFNFEIAVIPLWEVPHLTATIYPGCFWQTTHPPTQNQSITQPLCHLKDTT